ncbi:peptidase U32 [Vallitalea longa]|uniref:Peptidase U32 n=1 Tax=Vallitalea longa TaxID=2936439 RepID=A0A9W5YBZ0_9FIRM|nr:U32 family peptidase [Vallitalea longa]GKX31192.1 peptidase U32 [Vallitalea longa]
MKYYVVPADFKTETIDKYYKLNNTYSDSKVIETYGQLTIGNSLGSGRAGDLIPKIDIHGLKNYISYSRDKGIGFSYTLNATCLGNREFEEEGIEEILGFLKKLYEIGVRSLIIAMPTLFEIVKMSGYDFEIKASTLCQITNVNKAVSFKKLGVSKIVLEESINRDFKTIKDIVGAFGDGVEIIVNVICHKNCTYRMFHQNQVSHDKEVNTKSSTYYSHRCMMKRAEEPSNLLKMNWVRPEDIKYYHEMGIQYYKLQGRQAVLHGDMVKTVESYFKESFDGNLMDLLDGFHSTNAFKVYIDNKKLDSFLKPFRTNDNFCKNNCDACNYCNKFVGKVVDLEQTKEVFDAATKFYQQCDHFNNSVKKIVNDGLHGKTDERSTGIAGSVEFDFE